jgi:hypothetical protein
VEGDTSYSRLQKNVGEELLKSERVFCMFKGVSPNSDYVLQSDASFVPV